MDLSIIIPCHNLEKHIKNLLHSIDYQRDYTYSDLEIIFILDDCTDATNDILSKWIEKTPITCTLLYVNVHSCGLARNAGIEHAHGKYVWFVDGDDWFISNETFKVLLKWIFVKDENFLHIKWSSNSFPIPTWSTTVWQWLIKMEIAKEFQFDGQQPSEDDRYFRQIFQRYPPKNVQDTIYPLYFYNYGREDSNMTQINQKGRIDP